MMEKEKLEFRTVSTVVSRGVVWSEDGSEFRNTYKFLGENRVIDDPKKSEKIIFSKYFL